MLEFLGVSAISLTAAVAKLEQRSIVESIVNYHALKRHFAGSRWERFFDEDVR